MKAFEGAGLDEGSYNRPNFGTCFQLNFYSCGSECFLFVLVHVVCILFFIVLVRVACILLFIVLCQL